MQLKQLEDFVCLAQTRSFVRAAQLRHVTHPAFGRRIAALEQWVGCALIQRNVKPLVLTEFGAQFLQTANHLIAQLAQAQHSAATANNPAVSIVTGRTLARTLVADWLTQANKKVPLSFDIQTASLESAATQLQGNRADFMVAYKHPLFDLKIDAALIESLRLTKDRLVPVVANSRSIAKKGSIAWIAFSPQLALARLLEDQLPRMNDLPALSAVARCDSPDVAQALVLRGVGIAWLPWSLVARDCESGLLHDLGAGRWNIPFEVSIYRNKFKLGAAAESLWKFTKLYRESLR